MNSYHCETHIATTPPQQTQHHREPHTHQTTVKSIPIKPKTQATTPNPPTQIQNPPTTPPPHTPQQPPTTKKKKKKEKEKKIQPQRRTSIETTWDCAREVVG